jgi:hypothetical protein
MKADVKSITYIKIEHVRKKWETSHHTTNSHFKYFLLKITFSQNSNHTKTAQVRILNG